MYELFNLERCISQVVMYFYIRSLWGRL